MSIIPNRNVVRASLLSVLAASLFGLSGCNGGGPDPAAENKRVDYAKNLRSYFDKAGGDYSQLSATDKEAFVKLSGDQKKADENWNLMKNGPGAASRTGASPTTPPTGQ